MGSRLRAETAASWHRYAEAAEAYLRTAELASSPSQRIAYLHAARSNAQLSGNLDITAKLMAATESYLANGEDLDDTLLFSVFNTHIGASAKTGDVDQTLAIFTRALEVLPDHPRLLLGQARFVQKHVSKEAARPVYERILEVTGEGNATRNQAQQDMSRLYPSS
jgi:tetratricopeptide (TPR) repeat protein